MHFCSLSFLVVLSIFHHKITFKKCIPQNAYNHPSLTQGHILVAAKWVASCASCQIFLEKALTLRRISNSFLGHNGVNTLEKMGKLLANCKGIILFWPQDSISCKTSSFRKSYKSFRCRASRNELKQNPPKTYE